ncbi:MAG: hypothetical protein QNK37_36500 [Acidobacteriota bacterium]|nr:hypothetical protein [Acidobacteriota bacterium]
MKCIKTLSGLTVLWCLLAAPVFGQKLDMDKLKGLNARSIGPAGMSGRVTAIDVVLKDTDIIYIGTASGGVWRSKSGGIHWEPIFDDQPDHSIGALAVDQNNPDVIWVGAGEGNPRNSQSAGNGVYKSIDGGRTWKHLGLEKTRNIHRLLLHPTDSNVAYVGAQGAAWADTPDRGVYKTTDGGKTWQQILYVNERTGVGEMVMDPVNPNKLIVNMWEFRRWPWFFKSGGPGSGLHVTFDGGETWEKRTAEDGLPKGELGRMGLAISRSHPNVIYALIEAKKNALYRSDDGGFKWRKISDKNIGNRPFYYAEIYVDPKNENRIYNLYSRLSVSEDGGRTFRVMFEYNRVHPDHHAFWIHPDDPNYIIEGNDGGLAVSRDRGKTWRFVENLPLAQFYHIRVDNEQPYNIYGGMQDNGSWRGPGYVYRSGGIRNTYWEEVAFGDGFDTAPDMSDPRYGYAMSQGGNLRRYDLNTGNSKFIRPVHPEGETLRFNWSAGLGQDPFDAKTIYYGSQYVHKSTNRGDDWEIISPDLTTNNPDKQKQIDSGGLSYDVTQAENHTTILVIEPSPVQKDVLWVGTDDGNVQVTQDGGANWENVTANIKGLPENSWIGYIKASTYEAGGAFVVSDNHRTNDWIPYVYHTADFGKTWKRLVQPAQIQAPALSLIQDPVAPELIFLGTELGLYITIDGGAHWTKFTNGMPTASVADLAFQEREHDLIIGTFGRSAFVLDDIRPLRVLAQKGAATLDAELELFPIPDAVQATYRQASGTRFAGDAEFLGENRSRGAMISFVSNPKPKPKKKEGEGEEARPEDKEKPKKKTKKKKKRKKAKDKDAVAEKQPPEPKGKPKPHKVTLEILEDGEVIRTTEVDAVPGMNRVQVIMVRKGVRPPNRPKPKKKDAPEPFGAPLLPGEYTVRLSTGEDVTSEAPIVIHMDPGLDVDMADMKTRWAMNQRVEVVMADATDHFDKLRDAEAAMKRVKERLGDREGEDVDAYKEKAKDVGKKLKELMKHVRAEPVQGIRRDPGMFSSSFFRSRAYLGWWGPTSSVEEMVTKQLEERWEPIKKDIQAFLADDWPGYREAAESLNLSMFDD